MRNSTNAENTAARFRERAAECVKLAASAIDPSVEAQYRSLAERYMNLAECAEMVSPENSETILG